MFARVFESARRILSRSPSYQGRSSEARDTSIDPPDPDVTMVTTRGGIETPGSAATPVSSAKKRAAKRELDAAETPTQAKRQRKAAPKKKAVEETPQLEVTAPESTEDSSDTITVAAPTSEKDPLLPLRQRSSPRVIIAKVSPPVSSAEDAEYHTPEPPSGSAHATPMTRAKSAGSPTPKAKQAKSETPGSAKRGRGRPERSQAEDGPSSLEVTQVTTKVIPDEVPTSSQESDATPLASQDAPQEVRKAHMRFGSEEPTTISDTITVTAPGQDATTQITPQQDEDDDSGSDSDAAPEVVTTAAATSAVASARADAARAQQAQHAKEAARRAAREELLAAQAAAKREREEKKAKKEARKLARAQKAQPSNLASDDYEDAGDENDAAISRAPFEFTKSSLLPDSFLASLPSARPATPPPTHRHGKSAEQLQREKLNHHIKFLERSEKGVKDVKRGKLSVSVLGRGSKALPPKANRDTRGVREHWLKGRGLEKKKNKGKGKGKGERRRVGGGFIRSEDD